MEVTVIVGTFGAEKWRTLAMTRAIPSAMALGAPVIHVHGNTLHEARNEGAARAMTPWLCFLDADDELEAGFLDAMAAGTADLRAPSVRYGANHQWRDAAMPRVAGHEHACTADCLVDGNWLVIGTLIERSRLLDVGGFRNFEWSEDWDLWLRCYLAGATVEAIPDAVYVAHVNPRSRNRRLPAEDRVRVHRAIHDSCMRWNEERRVGTQV